MGETGCICRFQGAGMFAHRRFVMGCPVHDMYLPSGFTPRDADIGGEQISRDLNADRGSEATREAAPNDASPTCAPPHLSSNVGGGAFFLGVLGERPSGPLWQVYRDSDGRRIVCRGFGLAFAVDLTAARLLHYQLGVALDLKGDGS